MPKTLQKLLLNYYISRQNYIIYNLKANEKPIIDYRHWKTIN